MTDRMTVPVIAGIAFAILAAVLAVVAWVQRRRLRQLVDEVETAHQGVHGGHPAPANGTRAMLAAMREPALLHGERIEAVNEAFATLIGTPVPQLVGRSLPELVERGYAELAQNAIARALGGGEGPALTEVELADSHGQVTRLELAGQALESGGRRLALFTALEMLPRSGEAPRAAPARAELALEALGEGLVTTDAHGLVDYVNRAAEGMSGLRREDAAGQAFGALIGFVDENDRRPLPDPVQQCLAAGARVNLGRRALLIVRGTGTELGVEASASPIRGRDGEVAGVAVVLHDVSEQRGITQQMSYQASHDALTGLVNRREFERRLQEALEVARAARQGHVMCYLDLDRFKAVNDTSGHLAGDNMLREIAALIREAVRDSDTVARLGGDEFGVLLVGCPLEKARQIADDIWRAIGEYRFVWKDRIFSVGVSIGLVEVTPESNSLEEILSAADSACYVAKRQGDSHVHVYSSHDEAVARSRGEIHWLQRLQAALRDGFFELYVQPIEPTRPGGAGGGPAMEVFVRLHDEGQPVAPAEFFPAAERYRLMSLIDRWVLGSALAALTAGAIRIPAGRSLSINVSAQTLADPTFLEFVVDELDRTGVAPAQICFEVAETSVIGNIEQARRFIDVLHGMGCRFALDDFGTDLGGFANLRQLPMDYLKIGGDFMRDLGRDSVNQAMVSAVVGMARTLNFRLVAEQIEDLAALEAARAMGIDFVQGYAIGRPRPLAPAA
ncbi:MAG TPA: EAL domain-containing protein [Steroidobacteraceae bacterium]|nr:EAL domain-containing protein [Steroidobacteraceae bacterium]